MTNLPDRGVLGAAALLASIAGTSVAADIPWRAHTEDDHAAIVEARTIPQRGADRAVALARLEGLAFAQDTSRVVVTFDAPPTSEQREALEAGGLYLLRSVGAGSYFASVDRASLDTRMIGDLVALTDATAIQREWKAEAALIAGRIPAHAIVGDGPDPTVAAYALFHRDVAIGDAQAAVVAHGARVVDTLETINGLVIELPSSRVDGLIDDELVQWVEAALPRMGVNNASNRVITQAEEVQAAPYNLDGTGVVALVYDAGTARSTHLDFSGRCTVNDSSGMNYHANHVAGTVAGDGSANATHRGMAPNARVRSMGFEYDGSGTFLYTNPGDIETDYDTAFNLLGAHVSNNSIGTNTESNGFPCSYQGNYGVTSNLIDAIVDGALGVPVRIVWAGGNERGGSRCDVEGFGDFYSSAPPSCAKNSMVIGAINSDTDGMTSFSSWGPTDDGRVRPDFVGPGCQSGGDGGVTSVGDSSDSSYLTLCGTSMAAPTVTGLVALLLQDFDQQFPGEAWPANSTVKALLAHTAHDLGNPGPDYVYGYGSVRVRDAIDHMRTGAFDEGSVDQGGAWSALMDIDPGDSEAKITIAWDDAPAAPNVSVALVNDLDLVITDPNGVRHYPWTLDPLNPGAAAVRTGEDHLNNMEQVVVDNPAPGTWSIEVVGTAVPEGPQSFSVVGSRPVLQTGLQMSVRAGMPRYVLPGVDLEVEIEITAIGQSLIAGSPTFHWRHNDDAFTSESLVSLSGDNYLATIPSPDCGETLEFYFTAEGDLLGESSLPASAPTGTISPTIGEVIVPVSYAFEAGDDEGWAVNVDGLDTATTGLWNRMDPEGTSAQPESDHSDPGTVCWVTDGFAGASLGAGDVDGGATTLYSPVLDLSPYADATLGYYRWYSNTQGADPNNDVFVVEISSDGGATWSNVETVGPGGPGTDGGWVYHEFSVADLVVPTEQVRLRFIASDVAAGSLVEAGIDDLAVTSFRCVPVPIGCGADFNGDGTVDVFDFSLLAANFGAGPDATFEMGDSTGDGWVNAFDFGEVAAVFGLGCE
jgi:subtilisin family serine protease